MRDLKFNILSRSKSLFLTDIILMQLQNFRKYQMLVTVPDLTEFANSYSQLTDLISNSQPVKVRSSHAFTV